MIINGTQRRSLGLGGAVVEGRTMRNPAMVDRRRLG